ncbi:hypothetical protein Lepto7376_0239 [[Leptolyngbya] sp. PCC 7376]|uniref:DUF4149 domain-containing protein n=1 Tax=[Leptolyngbya] sp. PCC 7376 TaxID=111781 RepID=UPI00029EC8F2|nr:DUF4149 domain-containing protein [[Leptolyngbya] sp. PCC 7376]AFY36683.1 hypothetical protein Lepto7376_0239 [[Leptolyngbya] sp. PCC 7376]
MNTSSIKRPIFTIDWNLVVMVVLGFWLSASFLLDAVIVPVLFSTGMMADTGFISAGYVLFGVFNRLELVCAAIILTAFFIFRTQNNFGDRRGLNALVIASVLLNIALAYTYVLTPQISGWGLEMETITVPPTMPQPMIWLHACYWVLELTKFALGLTLWRWCYKKNCAIA